MKNKLSGIDYVDASWGPWYGCNKTQSPACAHCYAEREMKRYGKDFNKVTIASDAVWKKPMSKAWKDVKRAFVCPWGDFFHEKVTHSRRGWAIFEMNKRRDVTWIIPTKRPHIAMEFAKYILPIYGNINEMKIILLLSCANQADIDRWMPTFLQIPFGLKGLSLAPLLGPVKMLDYLRCEACRGTGWYGDNGPGQRGNREYVECDYPHNFLKWLIVESESGPNHRETKDEWVKSVISQCTSANVPLFIKQLWRDGKLVHMPEVGGRIWNEYPEEK